MAKKIKDPQTDKPLDPLALILPPQVFEHFDLTDSLNSKIDIHLFLDEKKVQPPKANYTSKGFTEQKVIQDFPLRGKPVFLHIRRRKWTNNETGEVITNTFDLTHLGTQITNEFAAFLKGIHRG